MSINDNALFGQLTLPEPEPAVDAATIKLNRALAGFLAGYSGSTLDAYRLDLRQWITWLATFHTDPFGVERAHIELYARAAEQEGKARSTIGRRLSTVCGFYRYCEQERLIERNPRISPHSLRHSFITAALDAGVPLRDVQEAASHSDPRTTMRYDRGRGSLDRHATYIVSTFVAGASR